MTVDEYIKLWRDEIPVLLDEVTGQGDNTRHDHLVIRRDRCTVKSQVECVAPSVTLLGVLEYDMRTMTAVNRSTRAHHAVRIFATGRNIRLRTLCGAGSPSLKPAAERPVSVISCEQCKAAIKEWMQDDYVPPPKKRKGFKANSGMPRKRRY